MVSSWDTLSDSCARALCGPLEAPTHCNTLTQCHTMPHTATHCHTLQHTATHCNTLQHTTTHCTTLHHTARPAQESKEQVLQHTATHCNTLQHTATHCNTLQHLRKNLNSKCCVGSTRLDFIHLFTDAHQVSYRRHNLTVY